MTLGIKKGRCRICEKEKKTEWHHIISQHHAKKTGQDHLIYNPNNVVELCKKCHNQTTASKCRYRFKIEKEINLDQPGTVKSPMVGTVYLASSPDAKPFITVGQNVKEGDQLFIIEAMKTMNPVKSPYAGKVKEIIVSNEMSVEFDEALVIIDIS